MNWPILEEKYVTHIEVPFHSRYLLVSILVVSVGIYDTYTSKRWVDCVVLRPKER